MSGQLADAEEAVLKSAAAEAVIAAEEKKLAATKSDLRHAEERLVKAVAARKEGEARIAELEAQLARYGVSSSGDESVRIPSTRIPSTSSFREQLQQIVWSRRCCC